jgi:hypothetical protein
MREPDGKEKESGNARRLIIGEVVEASTTRFVAHCPQECLYEPPPLGAFVRIMLQPDASQTEPQETIEEDPFADPAPQPMPPTADAPDGTLYAVVCMATTGSVEPGRRPAAYGLDEQQLREEQPQIFDLLTTEFTALHIGYVQGGRVRPYLPPRPPRLHAFVTPCTPSEVRALSDSLDFLRALLTAPGEVSPDELIAAALREAYLQRNQEFAFLVRAGKQLASLLRDDPDRLAALLRKLEP